MYLKFSFGLLAIVLTSTVFLLASGTAAAEVGGGSVPEYCGAINSNPHNGSFTDTVYVFVREGDSDLCYSFLKSTNSADEISSTDNGARSTDNSARSTDNGDGSNDDNARSVDAPQPIRTITEGQSTTFTTPNPQNRQEIYCSPSTIIYTVTTVTIDGIEYSTTTSKSRSAGAYNLPYGTERSSDEPFTCGTGSKRTVYGVCEGPYTLDLSSRDSRVTQNGNQIQVTTTPSGQGSDDTGTLEIVYHLNGTRTKSAAHYSGVDVVTNPGCTLLETARVEIRPGTRPGMTAAVAMHAPAQEFLSTPQTVTWTCTEELMAASTCPTVGDEITTTTQPTFPTPSGCRVIVTVSQNRPGHGSTGCLTNDEAASFGDVIDVDIDDLPSCPLSTAPQDLGELEVDSSGRQRCVATN